MINNGLTDMDTNVDFVIIYKINQLIENL